MLTFHNSANFSRPEIMNNGIRGRACDNKKRSILRIFLLLLAVTSVASDDDDADGSLVHSLSCFDDFPKY